MGRHRKLYGMDDGVDEGSGARAEGKRRVLFLAQRHRAGCGSPVRHEEGDVLFNTPHFPAKAVRPRRRADTAGVSDRLQQQLRLLQVQPQKVGVQLQLQLQLPRLRQAAV